MELYVLPLEGAPAGTMLHAVTDEIAPLAQLFCRGEIGHVIEREGTFKPVFRESTRRE